MAEDELSQNAYQPPEPSWWDRFSDRVWGGWIADNVLDLVGGSDTIRAIVIVIAILLALGLAVLVIRRVRRTPRIPKTTENAAAKVVLSGSRVRRKNSARRPRPAMPPAITTPV